MIKKMIMAATLAVASVANAGSLIMTPISSDKEFNDLVYDMLYKSHYEAVKTKLGDKYSVFAAVHFFYDEKQKFCAISMVTVVGQSTGSGNVKIDVKSMPHARSITSNTDVSEFQCGKLLGNMINNNRRSLLETL